MLKTKLIPVAATSVIWIICLSSCGGMQVKTWFTDSTHVSEQCRNEEHLVRRKNGVVQEALTIVKADGYRCYSPADDQAWRNRMAVCCAGQ